MECQGQMMGILNRSLTQAETTPNISQPMPPMLTVDPRVPEGLSVQPDVMAASRIVGTGTTIIPGEQHEQQLSLPPNLLFKKSNPIGTRVSQKVKDKIIADQYVDMATLIDHSQATDHSSHSQGEMFIQVADNIIKPVPKKKATQPLDIKQWTKAFHLYMAIYTKAHPQEAPQESYTGRFQTRSFRPPHPLGIQTCRPFIPSKVGITRQLVHFSTVTPPTTLHPVLPAVTPGVHAGVFKMANPATEHAVSRMSATNVGEAIPQTIVASPPTQPPPAEGEQKGGNQGSLPRGKSIPGSKIRSCRPQSK